MNASGDQSVVEVQIGRPLRADSDVVARCHLGLPVVVAVPPLLDDGTPFPTRFWLTCPLAAKRIGRLEAAGGVREMEERISVDLDLAEAMQAAHDSYAQDRDRARPEDADLWPSGGVGGIKGKGIKCLHAHYAHTAAGGANPVGDDVAAEIEPLDCLVPCVLDEGVGDDGVVERNPEWVEPR